MKQWDGPLSFIEDEAKSERKLFHEKGITLVALIITIIILVILAAVSISAVYKSKIINYAIDGAQKYAAEGVNENKVMEGTEKLIESAVNTIRDMGITGGELPNPNPDPKPEVGKPAEELGKTEYIGKYVDYKSAGSDYIVDKTYSGTDANQTFSANNSMKWRIWGVEGNKLLLISETLAGNIEIKGVEGYNNGVKLLNDACNTGFGNSTTYGNGAVVARSINQEDIDKVTNMTTDEQRKIVEPRYGTSYDISTSYINWPNIYGEERSKIGGGTLERSSQSSWYSGRTGEGFTGVYTAYSYDITSYVTHSVYDALLTNPTTNSTSGTNSNGRCWIASRCVESSNIGGNISGSFSIICIDNGGIYPANLYGSQGFTYNPNLTVRPMIEIDLSKVAIGVTGEGTSTSPYSMAKK